MPSLRLLSILFVSLFVSSGCAVDSALPRERIRIACVGDSITEGTANADHTVNSWPRVLGRMLEREFPGRYEVGNFGRSGATALKLGSKPYWDEDVFGRGIEFQPHVVVINLGTNDATERNWPAHGARFEADLRELVSVYRALDTEPTIWSSNLTHQYEHHARYEECAPYRPQVTATIAALSEELALDSIDLATPTAGHPELFPDGLHPNTAGNERIARAVFEALTGETAGPDPTLRPRAVSGAAVALVQDGRAVRVRPGAWVEGAQGLQGTGAKQLLLADLGLEAGDFHLRTRLRMLDQRNSAAGFVIGANFFGLEGARGTVFRNGEQMGGLRLLHPSPMLWQRDAWIDFEVVRNDGMVWFLVDGFVVDMALIPGPIDRIGFDPTRSTMQVAEWSIVGETVELRPAHLEARTVHTPWVDLAQRGELREEPGFDSQSLPVPVAPIRSPDGSVLLRIDPMDDGDSNSTARTSTDGGRSWSTPSELAAALTGGGHRGAALPDGRLLITFADRHRSSPTWGDPVAWIGTFEDVLEGREGEFTCRLFDHVDPGAAPENMALQVDSDGMVRATFLVREDEDREPRMKRVAVPMDRLEELVPRRAPSLPLVDLAFDEGRHVVVDREPGQYLGHVTTALLSDDETILAVYPKGHGRGPIVYKRSEDAGLTWSERLPTPESWATSREVPTIHRMIDPRTGKERLILWSGLYPARRAVSEDDGATWSELEPVGEWGGIVVMGFVERLADGSYLAMFHDDGRFISGVDRRTDPPVFTLYQTISHDGGLTWSEPTTIWSGTELHLCEPGCVRSPDGSTLAVLLRENSRTRNAHVIFSRDEARTWSAPRELPASLTGDRHTAKYAPDGRLFVCFRDTALESPTQGDWLGWVGTWEDILSGRPGQYRVRLGDNKHRWDTTYPGVEVLPDGTFVVTTYGHWVEGEQPFIQSVRFTLDELDRRVPGASTPRPDGR